MSNQFNNNSSNSNSHFGDFVGTQRVADILRHYAAKSLEADYMKTNSNLKLEGTVITRLLIMIEGGYLKDVVQISQDLITAINKDNPYDMARILGYGAVAAKSTYLFRKLLSEQHSIPELSIELGIVRDGDKSSCMNHDLAKALLATTIAIAIADEDDLMANSCTLYEYTETNEWGLDEVCTPQTFSKEVRRVSMRQSTFDLLDRCGM